MVTVMVLFGVLLLAFVQLPLFTGYSLMTNHPISPQYRRENPPWALLTDVMFLGMYFMSCAVLWPHLRAELTQEGVSQPRLTGRKFIRWADVRRATILYDPLHGRILLIESDSQTIKLMLWLFKSENSLIEAVKKCLPSAATWQEKR
jgi:hypothetical protein